MRTLAIIAFTSAVCFGKVAHAHVTLAQKEAPVGSSYRATFRVPHGCDNSPTLRVRVQIPDGVVGVKPMPKPGWEIDLAKGKYDKPYAMYHGSVTEGVKEVTWSGQLSDDYYDEFVISVYLTNDLEPGSTLYFPVVQECAKGSNRWIEIPAADHSHAGHDKHPAPGLQLLPKK
ncbi:MAG: YcnI family protein [Hyphomicrobiaceae bacterium]